MIEVPKTNSFPNADKVRCDNCIAFVPVKTPHAASVGQCRRNPPTVAIVPAAVVTRGGGNINSQTLFPPVIGDCWCSQFMPRPEGMPPHPGIEPAH